MQYKANFLWGFPDDTIESLGYEFANAKTEEYRKECWEALKQALQSSASKQGTKEKDELIDSISRMKDDSGREGCTYGDTKYDSLSAVYGFNLAIEQVVETLKKTTLDVYNLQEDRQADINNKLTPFKNMISMMEKGDPRLNGLIEKEMNQCKKNIEYLSTLPSRPIKDIKVGNEKIDKLNLQQKSGKVHPYTCDRKSKKCQVNLNDGVLIATKDGWICPCGEYKQKINQSCIPTEGKEITDEEITNLLSEAFETNTSITVEDDSTDKAEMIKDFIKAYRDLMNNK